MKPTVCALLLIGAAAVASAQEQPGPPLRPVEFVGADGIRKSDGMIVRFHKVNYVDAALLAAELQRWKSPKAVVTSEGPAFATAKMTTERSRTFPEALTTVQNTLRIEETEENWPVLRRVLDLIDVPQPQVYVEAHIAELTFDDDLRLGVDAQIQRSVAGTFFRSAEFSFPNSLNALDHFTTTFHDEHKHIAFDYVVELAQSGSTVKVIATPGIFASQGETAVIRSGDEEPIVQQTLANNVVNATTIFKDTGLRLEVQPLLIGRDAVRARISAQQSRVSDFRITATSTDLQVVNPVITSRNADTVVTVPDGETLVLAGLDSEITRDQSTGIPFLKDIPVIGYAFGSKTKRKQHTELVFFLTFRILRPGEARIVKPPSEEERLNK